MTSDPFTSEDPEFPPRPRTSGQKILKGCLIALAVLALLLLALIGLVWFTCSRH